ncbi:hypothetical protein ME792_16540 [Lactobacillus delbrueckii]|nr:hypothetical protein ME792_16540 [Lactobacillus delbrueckii]
MLAGLLLSSQPALADTADSTATNATAAATSTSTTTSSSTSSSTSKPVAKPKAKINLKSYLSKKSVAIRAKKSYSLVSKLSKNTDGIPVLKLKNGKYVAAKKSYVSVPKLYQNPKK